MNIKNWINELHSLRKPLPLLSFPSKNLIGANVYEITHSADLQVKGMLELSERYDMPAIIGMMDLSLEAEAFGATVKTSEDEVPVIVGSLVTDEDEANDLEIPDVYACRTAIYIDAAKMAKEKSGGKPVLAGVIGPFSLAGRLMDVTEALACCIADPDFVHATLRKTTDFLKKYMQAYKDAGVDGVVMAEPLAGVLSPNLEIEFSAPYVKELVDAVQCEDFAVIYHNCGQNTPLMVDSLAGNGAYAYHFGDAIELEEILHQMPADKVVMGNISPSNEFLNGTPESMGCAVKKLLEKCSRYENFVLSSGCDIPPESSFDNIDAFFKANDEFYK